MSRVLTTEAEVLALSPDAASSKAAKGLQSIGKWPVVGSDEAAVWGECQGSGSKPYQTQVDLSGPAFKCSCPSRKFPCKHGLALMLLRAAGQVPEAVAPQPEWVSNWLGGRQDKVEKKEAKAAAIAAASPPDPEVAAKQQAKREDKRWDKMAAGMQELSLWMQDMVRNGLANLAGDSQARAQWNNMAARMVDAQVPALSARIKEAWQRVDSYPGWPKDVLVHLAHWQLLVDAVQRRDALSAEVKADVMAALGWPIDKAEVLAQGQAVADEWQVVGLRMLEREGRLMERRVWLQGLQTGRVALVLDYSQGGRGFETAWLAGRSYRCSLHFYPGKAAQRALLAQSNGGALAEQGGLPLTAAVAAQPLLQLAQRVAANPLQMLQSLWCTHVRLLPVAGQWQLAWSGQEGGASESSAPVPVSVPVAIADDEAWRLLALTGGEPLQFFAEWEEGRCRLLSAWQAAPSLNAGDLQCVWQNQGEAV